MKSSLAVITATVLVGIAAAVVFMRPQADPTPGSPAVGQAGNARMEADSSPSLQDGRASLVGDRTTASREEAPPQSRSENESADPYEIFSSETMREVDAMLATLPEINNISDLSRNKEYMNWRKEMLPDFEWRTELQPHLEQSLLLVAEAQGIDSAKWDIPGERPSVKVNLDMDIDSVRRAMGYVAERDLDGYTNELRKTVDDAVVRSMIDTDEDAPIRMFEAR